MPFPQHFHFPNTWFMAKKTQIRCISFNPLISFLLCDTCNGRSSCVVLAVAASDGSSKKRSAIFLKMSKPNHIKIVIFKKHLGRSLRNI